MKILYITPSLPNDYSRIRTKNILTALSKLGCKTTILSLYSSKRDLRYLNDTKKISEEVILFKQSKLISMIKCFLGIFFPITLRSCYVHNNALHKYLKNNVEEYDLVYVKRLRMSQYARYFDNTKTYIDITDSLTKYYDRIRKKTKGIKKIINEEEYLKHKKYEIKIAKKYNTIICSEEDKRYLEEKAKIKLNNMQVIDNSIDTEKWINNKFNIKKMNKRTKLVFSGMMDYEPNVLAANYIIKKILPMLEDKFEIYFVGKNCSDEIKKYESSRIHFVGYVPDMKEELMKYDIYLCPIIAGSGVKNKILQASCVGLPIVSTNMGIEGIKEKIKKFVFVGNNPNEIVSQIKEINNVETDILKEKLQNQQLFIKNNYDISVGIQKLVRKI